MSGKPEFRREGDWFLFTWPEAGYGIGFDQLYESSGDLHAEITVQALVPVDGKAHVTWEKLNLSSGQTRKRLADRLREQTGCGDWPAMLEYACVMTGREYRRGEPVVNLDEIDAPPQVVYLMSKLLPLGEPTLMVADGDSCKSFLALALAVAVRTGLALPCGIEPQRQVAVLYLDWETSMQEQRRRLGWMARGLDIAIPRIHYRQMVRPLADDASRLRRDIAKLGIGFIIVDSAALATGGEPKEAEPVLRMMGAVRSFSPVTTLILAHVSKATAGNHTSERGRAYGSVFFENLGRSVWELRASRDGLVHSVGFFHRKVNLGRQHDPFALKLTFDEEAQSVRIEHQWLDDVAELSEHATIAERLLGLLRHGSAGVSDLAENLGEDPRSVRVALGRLAQAGKVIQLHDDAKGGRGKEQSWGLLSKP